MAEATIIILNIIYV